MNIVLTCILIYILLQLVIAFWFSRRNRNETDYLLAGRSIGPWMATFSVFATWFGAETCIGATGEAYSHGISGVLSDPFSYAAGIMIVGLFFAAALWKRGLTTLADLFRQRYGIGVERLAAVIMIPGSVMWAAAQVRAFGQVLASTSELGLFAALTLAAVVVIAYTAVGGMWADAVTDLVQGIILILGIFVLFAVFLSIGGFEQLQQLPPQKLDPLHERSAWETLDLIAVPIFSTIAAQELVSRILAMRGAAVARGATVAAGVLYLLIGVLPVLIGLGAYAYIGTDADPEHVLSLFAQQQLPMPLYILFLAALVSAILSTLSGALLVAGSLAAHNLVTPLMPRISEAGKLKANRIGVITFGLIAYGIALASESMYELVQEASALGSSGILILMFFAIWGGRFGAAPSAYAALIAGVGVYVFGNHVWGLPSPYLTSVAAALVAYMVCAGATFRNSSKTKSVIV